MTVSYAQIRTKQTHFKKMNTFAHGRNWASNIVLDITKLYCKRSPPFSKRVFQWTPLHLKCRILTKLAPPLKFFSLLPLFFSPKSFFFATLLPVTLLDSAF